MLATAVSGSPSSHLLPSTGPVMTVKFTSGGTDAQMNYSQHTGNIGPSHCTFASPTHFFIKT